MEEKKSANKMSYSTSGKRIRGLLLMITFSVFVAVMVFVVHGITRFSEDVLFEKNNDYFESLDYQVDISNEVTSLLMDMVYVSEIQDSFSVTNIAAKDIYYYDLQEIMEDCENKGIPITELSDLKPYIQRIESVSYDFYSADGMMQYLNSDIEGNYIYFSREAFKDLFRKKGQKNTNHRFSEGFSESAYFLFEDNRQLEEAGQSFIYEENVTVNTTANTTEVAISAERGDYGRYDLSEINYAVYDYEQDVFYSNMDDYFAPMDAYVYDAGEVAEWTEDMEYEYTDSIIFPLLRSMNYGMSGLWSQIYTRYSNIFDARRHLSGYDDSGLLYYVRNSKFEMSNIERISEIAGLTYAYQMRGKKVTASGSMAASVNDVEELYFYQSIEDAFSWLPGDTVFYFGIDTSRNRDDISEVVSNSRVYKKYAVGTKCFAVLAAIVFILIVVQAVWLIWTTGRGKKGDTNIVLNRFDRLPTEFWMIVYTGFLILCGISMEIIGKTVWQEAAANFNAAFVCGIVLWSVPYAFLFMVLTLSLARRIKAHNLWSGLYIRKIGGRICNYFKEVYEKWESAEKFLAAFVSYEVMNGICIFLYFTPGGEYIGILTFVLLQITAGGFIFYVTKDMKTLIRGVRKITEGELNYKVVVNEKYSLFKDLTDGINHIGDGLKAAVETSLKDERMKTELITNVSHDLKTPLTSIINYINLLKTEKMPTEEAEHYIEVLDGKAQRLKQLTEDLVEAAKVNTGNIELEKMPLAFDELMKQAIGEFEDKFATKNLTVIAKYPEGSAVILADGKRMFRIMENVLQNAYKYAMEGTRIYADLSNEQSVITFILKNISADSLNISPEELMERFTRGDSSRMTEGSGLGLSIAKDLTKLQQGSFDIQLDGDLFKVIITFPEYLK